MSAAAFAAPVAQSRRPALTESRWVRSVLIAVAGAYLALFLALPLAVVFGEALAKGWSAYRAAITEPEALAAVRLTPLAARRDKRPATRASGSDGDAVRGPALGRSED